MLMVSTSTLMICTGILMVCTGILMACIHTINIPVNTFKVPVDDILSRGQTLCLERKGLVYTQNTVVDKEFQ